MSLTSFKSVIINNFNLAPSQLAVFDLHNKNAFPLSELLDRELKNTDKGQEVGSVNYIAKSKKFFIRTRSLQSDSFIPVFTPETLVPIRPQVFTEHNLKKGDVLLSKDSNIGEAVMMDENYPDYMPSGALYKLPLKKYKNYIFAFIKHERFRKQLDLLVPKGATIRHAGTKFLECKVPFPNQDDSENVISIIEAFVTAIADKEKEIKEKNQQIINVIKRELENEQLTSSFSYSHPTLNEIVEHNRMDSGYYGEDAEKVKFLVTNYKGGYKMLDNPDFQLIPGPSLEIRLLGTRINSKEEKDGFYRLVTPKQITEFGTVSEYEYLGTAYEIPTLQKGDIVFGESGTGRSFVYMEEHERTVTNAHGHVLRPVNCSVEKAIAVRCFLAYLKHIGFIDLVTVGGSGGHLSPSYFNRIPIPNLSDDMTNKLVELYSNSSPYNLQPWDSGFAENDMEWNRRAGITELDNSVKRMKKIVNTALDKISDDMKVNTKVDLRI